MLPPNIPDKCQRKQAACTSRVCQSRAPCHRSLPSPTPSLPQLLKSGKSVSWQQDFLLWCLCCSAPSTFVCLFFLFSEKQSPEELLWCSAATKKRDVPAYCALLPVQNLFHSVTFYHYFFFPLCKRSWNRTVFMSNSSPGRQQVFCAITAQALCRGHCD